MGNNKNKNTMRIILIAIVICVLLIVALIGVMMFVKPPKEKAPLKFYVDQIELKYSEDLFLFQENQVYVSISDMAKVLGVDFYYGEYSETQGNEDKDKCYIRNEYEICSMYQNSSRIYKQKLNETDWEYFDIEREIKNLNGKLYITLEGFNTAFSLSAVYDVNAKYIAVYTLEYLYNFQNAKALEYNIELLATEYENKQALLNDMLVVIRDKKYGVIDTNGEDIIGAKYDKLLYMESTKEFLATIGTKVGILSETGQAKIDIKYDEMRLMDKTLRLWLVRANNIYGVLDRNGKRVIYEENDAIGVDITKFPPDKTHNGMILYSNVIPFSKDKKWGLYNKDGNIILPAEYDGFGCVATGSTLRVDGNLLTIPEGNAIVVCKNGLYGLVNSKGEELIPCEFTRIYKMTNLGQTEYYVEQNGNSTKLEVTNGSENNQNTNDNLIDRTQDASEEFNTVMGNERNALDEAGNAMNQIYGNYFGD